LKFLDLVEADKRSSGGVADQAFGEAVFVQLAVEGGAADAEGAGYAGHPATVVFDGEGDGVSFEVRERCYVARRAEEAFGWGGEQYQRLVFACLGRIGRDWY